MARKPRQFFKASAWELDDAEEENVEIVVNHSPKAFVTENGKLKGMLFDIMEYDLDAKGRITAETHHRRGVPAGRRHRAGHRPGKRLSLDRARPRHRVRQVGRADGRQDDLRVHACRACSSAATPPSARRTSSGRSSTVTRPPSRSTSYCQGEPVARAPARRHEPADLQDGHARVGLQQQLQQRGAPADAPRGPEGALREAEYRGRAGLHGRAGHGRGRALPELRRADGLHRQAVHRVRCLRRHLPGGLPDHHAGTAPRKNCVAG